MSSECRLSSLPLVVALALLTGGRGAAWAQAAPPPIGATQSSSQPDVSPPVADPTVPAATKSKADVLVFTNGDRLTGKLERASGGHVIFHSDMAGELTVPFGKVKELQSGSEFVALRKGVPGRIVPAGAGAVKFQEGTLTLTKDTGQVQTLPESDLGFLINVSSYSREVDHHASLRQGWTGSATGGLSLVRATESSTSFNGALNVVRTIPTVAYLPNRNRTTVNVNESYGTNRSPVIPPTIPQSPAVVVQTSIFHADLERDRYFTQRFYALGDVSFDHNFGQSLQLQQVYGLGAGWTPIKNDLQELDLRADVHYEKQQFIAPAGGTANPATRAAPNSLNLIGSTFQENYRRSLPGKIALTQWANILPAWNDTQAYSANAYIAVTLPLFKRLGATISATDDYLNNPAQYYKTNSVQFNTGVTYTIK